MSMIDGLISGLDTSGVINELLAAQRAPAQRLAARQQAIRAEATTFAGIRALVDQVKTAAQALDGELDWRAVKATSSDEAVATVVARSTATETSLSFTVDRLAQAHQLVSGVSAAADIEWADGDIVLEIGGEQHTITVTPNPSSGVRDLDSVVAAINGAGLDVRATKVNVGDGEHRLQLESVSTGAASEFTVVSGLVVDFDVARQAWDARIVLAGGVYTATSPTNTFKDLVSGIDVTVKKTTNDTLTISVAPDPDAFVNKVEALVNAVNAALKGVRDATRYDPATRTASVLTGDPTARRLASELTKALLDEVGASDLKAPGLAGISIRKDGTLTFDKAKFRSAYDKDPAAVQALFAGSGDAPGIATRLIDAANAATASGTGYLRTAEEMRLERANEMGKQITRIEEALERSALTLRRKFADMEAALGTLRQQSNWLAGQIASLSPANQKQ